tara:strand:+ start:1209 stop:3419 length:2211 start_codon:yes stop_codon:yes gene_type:complete
MQKIVLYIKNSEGVFKRMDMFNDESVVLKSQIQNIKDVGKVFTDFSRTFTLPSSKENNKLFKHYYNEAIENGFDARNKKEAIIELDFLPFKRGKIYLNSVKMKNNQIHSYNIIFYGNTVSLKDLLGDDELSLLSELDTYKHEYNNINVKAGLESGLSSGKIIYPLISHTKRFYYDSAQSSPNYSGNLYYNTTQNNIGLSFDDLKPAIKCLTIIEAIENKYSISFTRDFFSTTPFSNLFLWLSRNKGAVGGDENQEQLLTRICGDWAFNGTGTIGFAVVNDTWTVSTKDNDERFQASITVTPTSGGQTVPYKIKVIDYESGNIIGESSLAAGTKTFTTQIVPSFELVTYKIKFIIESESTLSFTPLLELTKYVLNPVTEQVISTSSAQYDIDGTGNSISTVSEILITENVPKIKIIDFLTGLFKMFNLTAYYIDDYGDADYGKVYVDTLDNFYADASNNPSGGKINITKYVDISNTEIKPSIQFTELDFKYQEPSTLLSINHKEQFNKVFGDESYKPNNVDRGTPYDIETPFEHMKFERIIDSNKASSSPYSSITSPQAYITDILWGYSASGEFDTDLDAIPKTGNYEPTLTKPLVFYAIQETGLTAGSGIKWVSTTTPSEITQYYRPSNTNEDGSSSTAPAHTINFSDEIDEWNLINYANSGYTNSLFKKFYESYIVDVFNQYKRIYKLKAKFPADFLINYRLNDILIIQDREFTINSISTNLKDGKSDLELLIKL